MAFNEREHRAARVLRPMRGRLPATFRYVVGVEYGRTGDIAGAVAEATRIERQNDPSFVPDCPPELFALP